MADDRPARVRLHFRESALSDKIKAHSLQRSWFLIDRQINDIADLSSAIWYDFQLEGSPQELQLFLDGFALLRTHSISLLRDGEQLEIQRGEGSTALLSGSAEQVGPPEGQLQLEAPPKKSTNQGELDLAGAAAAGAADEQPAQPQRLTGSKRKHEAGSTEAGQPAAEQPASAAAGDAGAGAPSSEKKISRTARRQKIKRDRKRQDNDLPSVDKATPAKPSAPPSRQAAAAAASPLNPNQHQGPPLAAQPGHKPSGMLRQGPCLGLGSRADTFEQTGHIYFDSDEEGVGEPAARQASKEPAARQAANAGPAAAAPPRGHSADPAQRQVPDDNPAAPKPLLKRRMSTQEEEFHKHKRAKPNPPQRAPPVEKPAAAAAGRGARQGPAAGLPSTASRAPQPGSGRAPELQLPSAREIAQLPPLDGEPAPGDAVVYKLLEIGPDWAPQVSEHRLGIVGSLDADSNEIVIRPAESSQQGAAGGAAAGADGDEEEEEEEEGPPSAYDEDGILTVQLDQLHDVRLLRRATANTSAPKGTAPGGGMQGTENASSAPQTRVTKHSTPATATTLTEKQSVGPHTRSRSQQLQHTQGGDAGGQPRQVLDATASQQQTDRQTPQGAAGPSSSQHEQRSQSAMHLVSPAGPGQAGAPQPGSGAADGQAAAKQGGQAVVQEESKVKKTSKKTKETKETVVEHKEESTGAGSEHHVSEGKHHRKEASAEEHAKEESTAVSRQQQGAQPDANGLAEMHWPLGGTLGDQGGESNGHQAQPGPLQRPQNQGQASAGGHPQENGSGHSQQHHQRGGEAAHHGSPQGLQTTPPARNLGPPVPAGRSPLPATGAWAELAKQLEQRKQELAHKAGAGQPSPSQGAAPQETSGTPQQKGDASQGSRGGTPQHNGSKPDSGTRHRSGTRGGALGPFLKRLREGQFD